MIIINPKHQLKWACKVSLCRFKETLPVGSAQNQAWKKSTWQRGLSVSLSCVDKGLIVPPSSGENNAVRGAQCGHCVRKGDTGSQRWHRRHGCRIYTAGRRRGRRGNVLPGGHDILDDHWHMKMFKILYSSAACFWFIPFQAAVSLSLDTL